MKILFDVQSVNVLSTKNGQDIIYCKLNGASPYPNLGDSGFLEIKAANGYGKEFCEKILGIKVDKIIFY